MSANAVVAAAVVVVVVVVVCMCMLDMSIAAWKVLGEGRTCQC
jgi:hypothetical protein